MDWNAQNIRELRLRLGWSVPEFGRRVGCSLQVVQQWEAGQLTPDRQALNQLSYLSSFVEIHAMRTLNWALADLVFDEQRLAQVDNQILTQHQID